MLFNSSAFLLGFLPICLAGFYTFGLMGKRQLALLWLTAMSFAFYGWWDPANLLLLVTSIGFNYLVARRLAARRSKRLLLFGIGVNVLTLGVFKYTAFITQIIDQALGLGWRPPSIALPLAISFFTFQQIAFLADTYDEVAEEPQLLNYGLFITFFPHLIAGPITHHREMMPQFNDDRIGKPRLDFISLGATVFLIGLFKKVIIADGISVYVSPVFDAAARSASPSLFEAWGGALAYAMQIYFDFSGYSDMAIGLGLLFGIRLPVNFSSPYRATSIIEYWQRWHMTLTRFLTAYIFNPLVLRTTRKRVVLGRSILKPGRASLSAFLSLLAMPLMVTMFIAGVWHGAGWQFIIFGLLHGMYLTVNHGWRLLKAHWKLAFRDRTLALRRVASVVLTFLCTTIALIFFRSADVPAALRLIAGMIGANGAWLPAALGQNGALRGFADALGVPFGVTDLFSVHELFWLPILGWIVWFMPNVNQWMRHYETALGAGIGRVWYEGRRYAGTPFLEWHPTIACGCIVGALGIFAVMRAVSNAPTEFLYFKF